MINLGTLLAHLPDKEIITPFSAATQVDRIVFDSRRVTPGAVFVAVPGKLADGHRFIGHAIANGATAIVAQRAVVDRGPTPYIITPDSRLALSDLAAAFFDFPGRKLRVIGVTGTDGKTTTATFIKAILDAAGRPASLLTTIGAVIGQKKVDTGVHVTTPDPFQMQQYLAQMVAAGSEFAIVEATSHGLTQHRVRHVAFDTAVITNVTHEHLDYHGTYENYLAAKALLFRALATSKTWKPDVPKTAVLNRDDASFERLHQIATDRAFTYSMTQAADFHASNIQYELAGTHFDVATPAGRTSIDLHLTGRHNVYNALAAMAAAGAHDIPLDAMRAGLAAVPRIIGRMERVVAGQPFDVFMDYAHTPNAIEQVLLSARKLTRGKLIVVAGLSGGLRDPSKRRRMGEIVGRLADTIVLTAMDWYEEDVSDIIDQIAVGCRDVGRRPGRDYWCERERRAGIQRAIELAGGDDLVVVTGKAHETALQSGPVEEPWDERAAIVDAIKRKIDEAQE